MSSVLEQQKSAPSTPSTRFPIEDMKPEVPLIFIATFKRPKSPAQVPFHGDVS